MSLAETLSTQRDAKHTVGRSKRKHHSADTSCPYRAEVNYTRRVCGFAGMNPSPIPAKKNIPLSELCASARERIKIFKICF